MEAKKTRNGATIVLKKELKLLFKSKRRVLLLFMMPIVIVIGGLTTSFTIPSDVGDPVVIKVIDENPTNVTSSLKSLLSTINNTIIEEIDGNYIDVVNRSDFDVLLYIPENFSTLLLNGNQSVIYIHYSSSSFNNKQVATQVLFLVNVFETSVIQSLYPGINFNLIDEKIIVPTTETEDEGGLRVIAVIVPVYIILFVIISPLSLVLISVTIEREQKTLEMLFLQPVDRKDIMLGKLYYGLTLVFLTLILDIAGFIIAGIIFFSFTSLSSDSIISSIKSALTDIPVSMYIGFIMAMLVISILIVATAILFSLIAKDEREANMISGLLPMLIVGMMFILFLVPIETYGTFVQLLLVSIPVSGVIFAIYLSTITQAITWVGLFSLFIQLFWSVLVINFIVKLSESDSILELNYSRILSTMKQMFKK